MKIIESYIDRIWKLKRDLVSDGFDMALDILSEWLPLKINRYKTGSECFTWVIPPKWTCREAYLKDKNGRIIFSYDEHPLHCMSYSLPFEGWVKLEDLKKHLFYDEYVPDAIPWRFKPYERTWGLCCSKNTFDQLNDSEYYVKIDSSDDNGYLKVGEYYLEGKTKEEIVLIAHLCHPHQFNDDLAGCIAGMAVMEDLKNKSDSLKYSYRLLLVPETIGSIAWLSDHENEWNNIVGGLFLEMLATKEPLALQKSYFGTTQPDKVFETVLRGIEKDFILGEFREIAGNDEKQFNSPGIRIPVLSLSRAIPEEGENTRHFRNYHTSFDTPENASMEKFFQSIEIVKQLLHSWENNFLLKNKFRGEIFCSRYNLFIDKYEDAEENKNLFNIMHDIDGSHTVADIAFKHKISFNKVLSVVLQLQEHDLIELLHPKF